jgi:hypothetical protein
MTLLPPRVVGPLSECSTGVRVQAQLTGSEVKIYADLTLVGNSIAASADQIVNLPSSLSPGQKVTATQTVGMETSIHSPDAVVVQKKPPNVGTVSFLSHLHVCGKCIWLNGLVPGASVKISGNGGLRGSGQSYDGNARVGLNGPIATGEILVAQQEACGMAGPNSPGSEPDYPGGGKEKKRKLPAPTIESPLRACQKGVVVSDVYDGGHVTLLRSGGPNLQACFDLSSLRFTVNPPLSEGEAISARQEFLECQITSDDAIPITVEPAQPIPPPSVEEPLCEGSTSVRLHNLIFGSKVKILIDDSEIGIAESPVDGTYDFPIPPLPPPLPHGSHVTAQQELCTIWSSSSKKAHVEEVPAELDPPKVSEPLFECGAVVHVSNIHKGARVYVFSTLLAAPIGESQVFDTEGIISVAPLLIEGDKIYATQRGCGMDSDPSESVLVQKLKKLSTPKVAVPVYDCSSAIKITNVTPGAKVEVYVNGAFRGSGYAGKNEVDITIIGKLNVGDQVQARQLLCGQITPLGQPVTVEHFDGRWLTIGDENKAEILAVHAALLPTNEILYFGGDQHTSSLNQNGDVDHTRIFNCETHAVTPITGLLASADLFCAGHAQLPDGRILVGGGTHKWPGGVGDPHGHGALGHFVGSRESWLFDPSDMHWHRTDPLVTQRLDDPERDTDLDIEGTGGKWYPTLLTLPDSRVLAVTGHAREFDSRHNNNTLESWNSDHWDYIGTEDCNFIPRYVGRTLEYPRMFVLPNDYVISTSSLDDGDLWRWHIGNNPNDWIRVTSPRPNYAGNPLPHTSVLLPLKPKDEYRARILMCGESQAWVLDTSGSSTWHSTMRVMFDYPQIGDVNPRRENLDAVMLPTGEIFVGGGVKSGNSDATGVKKAEMFDPEDTSGSPVGTWRVLPEAQEVRNYHSVALLMPNGSVWVAGSDINSGTGLANRNLWIEIFEPWYFCYRRPIIERNSKKVQVGKTLTIVSPDASVVKRVVLIRCGTCTHNFNPDQRLIELQFDYQAPDRIVATAPPRTNVAIPGYYLLFIQDQKRVPSIGRFLQILPP